MKPPLKPFTVEVKRSRSTTSFTKPISSAPPAFLETMPAPAPVAPSQARQLAEQLFTSLSVNSSAAPETKVTAESVFRTVAPRAATVEEPTAETTAKAPTTQVPTVEVTVPAKPREPRAGKMRTSLAPANKAMKPNKPNPVKAAALSAPARVQQDPRTKPAEMASPPVKIDEGAGLPSAPGAERQGRQTWGWGPGERWMKRLRYLR
ncbi:hypothetical protein GCM10007874_47100 [Labrys miyagiensis]|uniref:Uncharacterized protein n=1 Tax=Labrys miyagiensis TaxID=346912 RepID=A0ABQ6CMX5_9HYPH|nr:hypothetical protein [Labrys miyagiensis]GLS21693.1 hypothetical protein GCM10007874_47100 [Labrys miyagiensis]